MPEPALSAEEAALLASQIASGAPWTAISRRLGGLPVPRLKRASAKLRLAHDAPGDWPQIIDPDECDDDGVARPLGDPLLKALEGCHSRGDVRDVPVRRGTPRRVTGSAPRSLHGSPALDSVER